jgi:prepilin-type N-terminal cleavage/methylation domain-containing protein
MTKQTDARHRKQTDGFTLVEMILSITLIALMSLALWATLRISIATWKRGTEAMDQNQRHRATLDLMQKQMASVSAIIPALDLQLGVGQFPIFLGTEYSVQFITPCPMRFRDNPGLTYVSYEIVPGNEGEFALVEHESRYFGGDPTQTVSFGPADPAITIFEHISTAFFEYLDPGDQQIAPSWVSAWNSGDTGMLPAAISLSVRSRENNGAAMNRNIVIPLLAEPDELQGLVDPFGGRSGASAGNNRGGQVAGQGRGNQAGNRGDRGSGQGRGDQAPGQGRGNDGRGRGGDNVGPGGPGRGPGSGSGGRGGGDAILPGGRSGGRVG